MCLDPITATAAGAAVGGTVLSAYGGYLEATSRGNAYAATAVARRTEAQRTRELGEVEEEQVRTRNRIVLSQQVADLAAAGRDPTSGTALALAYQSARQGEIDALKPRTEAILKSDALAGEAEIYRSQAKDIRSSRGISAAARILSGVSRLGPMLA